MREGTPEARDVQTRDCADLESVIESVLHRSPASIDRIPAGLGNRRFYRIRFDDVGPPSLIARIEEKSPVASPESSVRGARVPIVPNAPAWLPEPALEPIRGFLEEAGLRVPRSYAHRPEKGIDLLEDVGDRTLADVPSAERPHLYRVACAYIPQLQALRAEPASIPAFGRRYDSALVATKLWKWLHWAIPLLLEREATRIETEGLGRLFARIAELAERAPMRLSHRDFKAENLHWLPAPRPGPQSAPLDSTPRRPVSPPSSSALVPDATPLVMIDVQGAFLAPPEYDLVCLLYDLQVELDEEFIQAALRETLASLPDPADLETALLRFDALAVARLCKDLAHVVHAGCVRGDRRRWHEIPRGLTLLGRASDRLRRIFPEVEPLTSVIRALTPAIQSADTGDRG